MAILITMNNEGKMLPKEPWPNDIQAMLQKLDKPNCYSTYSISSLHVKQEHILCKTLYMLLSFPLEFW